MELEKKYLQKNFFWKILDFWKFLKKKFEIFSTFHQKTWIGKSLRATFCKNQTGGGTHPLRIGSNSFFCWFGMFWQWNGHLFCLDALIFRNFDFWKKNWFSIFSKFEKSSFWISSFWKPQQNQMTFLVCMDRLDFKITQNPQKSCFSCWRLNLGLGKEGSKFG